MKGMKTGGREAGTPNKLTRELKEMAMAALEAAGGEGGGQAYLTQQARDNPTAFLALIGKFVPRDHKVDVGPQLGVMLQRMLERRAGRSKPAE